MIYEYINYYILKVKFCLKSITYILCNGGAGGNRTPVRKHSTESSTCLAIVVFV